MKEVIRLNKKEENEKPVEFKEKNSHKGWTNASVKPSEWDFIFYRETIDGLDYFIAWDKGDEGVMQYRGHLNSGKY